MLKKVFLIFISLLAFNLVAITNRQATIELKGMTCQSCAKAIRSSLLEVPGVKKVNIDLKKGLGQISIDNNVTVTDEQLKRAVEKAGYTSGEIRWLP